LEISVKVAKSCKFCVYSLATPCDPARNVVVRTPSYEQKHKEIKQQTQMPKKVVVPSARRSLVNLRADAKANAKALNDVWGIAKKSQFLLRPQKMDATNPKKPAKQKNLRGEMVTVPQRMNRVMRKHPLRVLLSAAAAETAATLDLNGQHLRTENMGENSIGALPAISKGAELEFERFIVNYCQTVFEKALSIRDCIGMHTKVTEGSMSAACKITNSEISGAGGIAPGVLVLDKTKKKVTKKKDNAAEIAEDAMPPEA
jgi:hypothetical protein